MLYRAASTLRRFGTHAGGQLKQEVHAATHHQAETAMITNNGTHVFERKGFEWSTWMGILGGPVLLCIGLDNAPDTDFENWGRREAIRRLRADDSVDLLRRSTTGGSYVYVKSEIGERPSLAE